MTHATITTTFDLELECEVDGDYWRYEDESVQDLTLCALYAYEPQIGGLRHDLLQGLDRPSRLVVERNLFKISNIEEQLCRDIEALGEDLQIEPDHDQKDDL